MVSLLSLPFVQRGLLEVGLLAVIAGVLGPWIVLRGLSFYVHATGTAAFPGLVLADGLAFSGVLGALATAAAFAVAVGWLGRRDRDRDTLVAVLLVGCLAAGVLLASDVFHSGGSVDTLLFGSLLLIGGGDLVVTAAIGATVLACALLLGGRWLARGFDADAAAGGLGLRSPWPDLVLLGVVAIAAVSSLQAIGGLLVTSLFVVPAATTRLLVDRLGAWQLATIALAAAEGATGLLVSVQTDTPPGAAIAVTTALVFGVVVAARMVPRRLAAIAVAGATFLALAGCGSTVRGPTVVAATTQLADVARSVAGPDARVVAILRPNTDPHEYEPRPGDVRAVAGAELVLESGAGLDGWMAKVLDEAGGDPSVLDVGAKVPVRRPGDPHWWHDPSNVEWAATRIGAALADAIPAHAAAFRRRARRYVTRVRALDHEIAACLDRVPRADRKLVTDHDAFGSFAARYGIAVVGAVIPSQSTQGQASAGDLARLSEVIRREGVKAVFPESSVSPKVARALARQTGATADLTLYGDTLGPEGSAGATYLSMEAANADAMVRGFTGGRLRCGARP